MNDGRIEQAVRTLHRPHMPVRTAVDLALREAGTVSGAAALLGVPETTLHDWIHRSGLEVGTYRFAFPEDEDAIVRIARQYRNELGYVMRPALRESMARRSLFVAVHDSRVVGFVNSRRRRDGVNVIYEIAVHREVRGQRIGAALLNAIPKPLRLKVTLDNTTVIGFYERAGMLRVSVEAGRKRELAVYEMGA